MKLQTKNKIPKMQILYEKFLEKGLIEWWEEHEISDYLGLLIKLVARTVLYNLMFTAAFWIILIFRQSDSMEHIENINLWFSSFLLIVFIIALANTFLELLIFLQHSNSSKGSQVGCLRAATTRQEKFLWYSQSRQRRLRKRHTSFHTQVIAHKIAYNQQKLASDVTEREHPIFPVWMLCLATLSAVVIWGFRQFKLYINCLLIILLCSFIIVKLDNWKSFAAMQHFWSEQWLMWGVYLFLSIKIILFFGRLALQGASTEVFDKRSLFWEILDEQDKIKRQGTSKSNILKDEVANLNRLIAQRNSNRKRNSHLY